MIRPVIAAVFLSLAVSAAGADDKVEPKSSEKIKKLQVERRDVLKKAFGLRNDEYLAGRGTLDVLITAAKDLLAAELAVAPTAQARVAAHASRLEYARKAEELMTARYDAGRVPAADNLAAKADRLEAEIGWLKAGGVEKAKKDK